MAPAAGEAAVAVAPDRTLSSFDKKAPHSGLFCAIFTADKPEVKMRNDSLEGQVSSLLKENASLREDCEVSRQKIAFQKAEKENLTKKVEELENLISQIPGLLADALCLIIQEARDEAELRETLAICLKNLEDRPDFKKQIASIDSPLELSLWLKTYQQNPA